MMKVANPSRASHGKFAASVLDGGVSVTINANAKPAQEQPQVSSSSTTASSSTSRSIHSSSAPVVSTAEFNAAQRAEQHALNLLFVNDQLAFQPLTSVLRRDPFCIPRATDPVSTAYRPVYNPLSILEKEEKLLPSHLKLDLTEAPPSASASSSATTCASASSSSSPKAMDVDEQQQPPKDSPATSQPQQQPQPEEKEPELFCATPSGSSSGFHENLLMGTLPRASTCNLLALEGLDTPMTPMTPASTTTSASTTNDNDDVSMKASDFQFLTLDKEKWTQTQTSSTQNQLGEPLVMTPSGWPSGTVTFGNEMDMDICGSSASDYEDQSVLPGAASNARNPSTPETLTKYLPTKSPRSQMATFADPCSRTMLSVSNEQFQQFLLNEPPQSHPMASSCSMQMQATNGVQQPMDFASSPLKRGSPSSATADNQAPGKKPRARANFRPCRAPGCNKGARGKSGLCQKHGGGKRCAVEGCPKGAQGSSNHCLFHGGGYRCTVEGCTTGARGTSGLCAKHGGYKRRKDMEPITAV